MDRSLEFERIEGAAILTAQQHVDALQTAVNERALDYRIDEKIYAGYAMGSVTLGDLTAIGGVRVELGHEVVEGTVAGRLDEAQRIFGQG